MTSSSSNAASEASVWIKSLSQFTLEYVSEQVDSESGVVECNLIELESKAAGSGAKLVIDLNKKEVGLPEGVIGPLPLTSPVPVNSVRYAACIDIEKLENPHKVVLSIWGKNKEICNLYFTLDDVNTLKLLKAVSKLIRADNDEREGMLRLLHFGQTKVSECHVNQHRDDGSCCCNLGNVLWFLADPEYLGFFQDRFNSMPGIDFRFYREQGEKSIDVITINRGFDSIQVQQGPKYYVIRKSSPDNRDGKVFDELVKLFKGRIILSRPEEYFFNTGRCKSYRYEESGRPETSYQRPAAKFSGSTAVRSDYAGQEGAWGDSSPQWLSDLYTGRHISHEEELLLIWCTCEADLQQCIKDGTVPHINPNSGGLDPKSYDHLQQSLEDIKDHLFKSNASIAVSRLRACVEVFRGTLLERVAKLDEVELLKRIFFLSGQQ